MGRRTTTRKLVERMMLAANYQHDWYFYDYPGFAPVWIHQRTGERRH
jgi:hypothetical protein